jgi:ATP-dependent Lhr-like helicase
MNATEMAKRKFRDIASIAGLVFKGMPGRPLKERHMRANSSLFFDVFREHEPEHLLLRQAYDEAFDIQMELPRMREALERIQAQRKVLKDPGQVHALRLPHHRGPAAREAQQRAVGGSDPEDDGTVGEG